MFRAVRHSTLLSDVIIPGLKGVTTFTTVLWCCNHKEIRKLCGIYMTSCFYVCIHRLSLFTEYPPAVIPLSCQRSEPHVQCASLLSQCIRSFINLSEVIAITEFGNRDGALTPSQRGHTETRGYKGHMLQLTAHVRSQRKSHFSSRMRHDLSSSLVL